MSGLIFNRRWLVLGLLFVAALGLGALQTLPRAEDPTITARGASVTTLYPGANAERVEALVTQPIEEAIRTLSEVDEVSSVSRAGVSIVSITLRDEVTEVAPVWSEVRDRLADVGPDLPAAALEPALNDDRGYAFTVAVSLTWSSSSPPNRLILQRYAEALEDSLRSVPGTDYVEIFGDSPAEVDVAIDANALRSAGLDVADIARALAAADARSPAGSLTNDTTTLTVELAGSFDSLTRLREVPIVASSGQTLRLGDVATFRRAIEDPPRTLLDVDGAASMVVGTRMQLGQRVDLWVPRALEVIDAFRARDAKGVEVEVFFEQAGYTSERLDNVIASLGQGLFIVVVVLLLTMGVRSALIVGVAIPATALASLGLFPFAGIEIHQMSLVGIIVALGLMVDNAIIMTNEIRDALKRGISFSDAVSDAIRKLFFPLLASTLTTILAFMPIVLLPGAAGEFVGPMAIAVILALTCSFVLGMTLIPALAPVFLREKTDPSQTSSWLSNGLSLPIIAVPFRRLVKFFLARPMVGIAAGLALPIIGMGSMATVPNEFFPPADRDQFRVEIKLPQATSVGETAATARRIDTFIREKDGVTGTMLVVGEAGPQLFYNVISSESANPAYAEIIVNTVDADATARLIPALQADLDAQFPEALTAVMRYMFGPPVARPIELKIIGPDLDTLAELGQEATAILGSVPGVVRANAAMHKDSVKLEVVVDEDAAKRAGFELGAISNQLQGALSGQTGGFVLEDTEQMPVKVRYADRLRGDATDLRAISLTSPIAPTDTGVPLSSIAEVDVRPAWVDLQRLDGERLQIVGSQVAFGVVTADVLERFRADLEAGDFTVPPGYRMVWGGEADARGDAIGSLLSQVAVLMVLAIGTIVIVFNSYRRMVIVLVAGGMAFGLGLFVLKLSGFNFGFMIVVGAMGLIGVGINNTIVMMASFDENPAARAGDPDAMLAIATGPVARHIWSTAITTSGGFVPLILVGDGFWPPFATTFAGGLLLLTIVTFFFTPCAYRLAVQWGPKARETRRRMATVTPTQAGA